MLPGMGEEVEHGWVHRSRSGMLLELYRSQASVSLHPGQILVECVSSFDGLQLLEVADEDHEGARAQLAEGNLQACPDLCIDLADFVQDDEIILAQSSWRVVLFVLVSGHLEG